MIKDYLTAAVILSRLYYNALFANENAKIYIIIEFSVM